MSRGRRSVAHPRGGFTLAELAVAVMITGILAGLALPAINYAVLKADAAHMASDGHTVQLAAYDYLAENGRFPPSGTPGVIPPGLVPHLPANFEFQYKGAQYWWFALNFPNDNNAWKTRNLGLFVINYSARRDFADPMYSYVGNDTFWSTTMFYFLWRG